MGGIERRERIGVLSTVPSFLLHLGLAPAEAYLLITCFPDYAHPNIPWRDLAWCLFLAHILLQLLWNVLVFPAFFSPYRNIPGPNGLFTAHGIVFDSPRGVKILEWMREIPNEGLLRTRAYDGEEFLVATTPDMHAEILVHHAYDFAKPFHLRKFLSRIVGWALISSEGDMHRAQRRALMPAFQLKHIRALYPLMWDKSVLLTSVLEAELLKSYNKSIGKDDGKSKSKGKGKGKGKGKVGDRAPDMDKAITRDDHLLVTGSLNFTVWASRLTLDIIGRAAIGRDFRALQDGSTPIAQNYVKLLEPNWRGMFYFAMCLIAPPWLTENWPGRTNRIIERATSEIRDVCRDIIREKKKTEHEAEKQDGGDIRAEDDGTNKRWSDDRGRPKDILSIMLRGKDIEDEVCVDQILTFLTAGATLRAELREAAITDSTVITDPSRPPIPLAELESLPLLNAVCNEVLRLHPPVPVTARQATRNLLLAGRVPIKAGCWLVLSPWATNRDPQLWGADAEEFRPERWIDAAKDNDNDRSDDDQGHNADNKQQQQRRLNSHGGAQTNYAMMTFLHGPRSCIGSGFARAELRCAVAALLGRFQVRPAGSFDAEIINDQVGLVVPKPRKGIYVTLSVLKGWCVEP